MARRLHNWQGQHSTAQPYSTDAVAESLEPCNSETALTALYSTGNSRPSATGLAVITQRQESLQAYSTDTVTGVFAAL